MTLQLDTLRATHDILALLGEEHFQYDARYDNALTTI